MPILFSALLIPGIFLVFVPFIPAIPYMMLVALVFKLTGTGLISYANIGVLLSLTILSVLVDWSAGLLGAKYGGAHASSLIFGLIGAIIGVFVFPPFGGIAGLFLGILVAEYRRKRDSTHAVNAASGALIGTLVGMLVNFCIALIFAILFIIFVIV